MMETTTTLSDQASSGRIEKAAENNMNQADIRHYSMVIQWDPRDNIYVVAVPELPGCMTHGKTYEEAVRQGQDAIESWIMAALADNEPIPPPRTLAIQIETVLPNGP